MPSPAAPSGSSRRLSRRTLLAGASAAITAPALAAEPCPDELERKLSMHQYRLQFQSWTGLVARAGDRDNAHFVTHCVRNDSASMVFIDWKGPGLAGYVDESAPLFGTRTYNHNDFTRIPTVLWYGSRPTDRDTDIASPQTVTTGFHTPHASTGAFNLPSEVRWSASRHQYVATHRADTRRGGGIFLHVQRSRHTAGCVAGPLSDIRWTVRWLDPAKGPRIVMGPTAWVRRTY